MLKRWKVPFKLLSWLQLSGPLKDFLNHLVFNLVTDLVYVAGVVSRAENVILREVSNTHLFDLLSRLIYLISHQEQLFCVMHVRSHIDLPGFIAEGSQRADALVAPAEIATIPNVFQQAKLSHQFHQNVPGLVCQFHLRWDQAKAIVATYPNSQKLSIPCVGSGVNPRGLNSCEVWQTNVTHIPTFGRHKYVHVSVDTFSRGVYASTHTWEKSADAQKHLVQAFSVLGIPMVLRTDNRPIYASNAFREFLQQWEVEHKKGISYSPKNQAIIEHTHQTLEC